LLHQSIAYALDHREAALRHALQYARDLEPGQADEFVGMYVNARTLDYGEDGRKAVQLFLDRGHEKGLIPRKVRVRFADEPHAIE
jgi:1,4-dihydroxy-6-naphthoate synthase